MVRHSRMPPTCIRRHPTGSLGSLLRRWPGDRYPRSSRNLGPDLLNVLAVHAAACCKLLCLTSVLHSEAALRACRRHRHRRHALRSRHAVSLTSPPPDPCVVRRRSVHTPQAGTGGTAHTFAQCITERPSACSPLAQRSAGREVYGMAWAASIKPPIGPPA